MASSQALWIWLSAQSILMVSRPDNPSMRMAFFGEDA